MESVPLGSGSNLLAVIAFNVSDFVSAVGGLLGGVVALAVSGSVVVVTGIDIGGLAWALVVRNGTAGPKLMYGVSDTMGASLSRCCHDVVGLSVCMAEDRVETAVSSCGEMGFDSCGVDVCGSCSTASDGVFPE